MLLLICIKYIFVKIEIKRKKKKLVLDDVKRLFIGYY